MQIFWPEYDLKESAMALDDKRLNKQIIELGQILSTAIWIEDCDIAETLYAEGKIYLPSHENHPVVRNCKYYYFSAVDYLYHLILEYEYRFKKTPKASSMFFTFIGETDLFLNYRQLYDDDFKSRFNNHTTNHKHIEDTNEAYRLCLAEKWANGTPVWTNRNKPEWA